MRFDLERRLWVDIFLKRYVVPGVLGQDMPLEGIYGAPLMSFLPSSPGGGPGSCVGSPASRTLRCGDLQRYRFLAGVTERGSGGAGTQTQLPKPLKPKLPSTRPEPPIGELPARQTQNKHPCLMGV